MKAQLMCYSMSISTFCYSIFVPQEDVKLQTGREKQSNLGDKWDYLILKNPSIRYLNLSLSKYARHLSFLSCVYWRISKNKLAFKRYLFYIPSS